MFFLSLYYHLICFGKDNFDIFIRLVQKNHERKTQIGKIKGPKK